MRGHPIRKFLGLTVLYAVLIIGVFILQFKTESVITHNVGALKVTLAQTENENNTISLRNQLQVNFRGLSFVANEKNPVIASVADEADSETALELSEYIQSGPLSVEFIFNDNSHLTFTLSDDTENSSLFIEAVPPKGYNQITIPFQTAGGYTVTEQQEAQIILASRNETFALAAPLISADRIGFVSRELLASYSPYDPEKRFTFDSILDYPLAGAKVYESTVKQIRSDLITKFNQVSASANASSLSEQAVIAYVAEMACLDRYDEAVDAVPESFKKGNKRTYLSSPYFDNLSVMNNSLIMQTEKYASMVSNAISTGSLDIFTVEGISDYILRERMKSPVHRILSLPASQPDFDPTILQAAGILNLYVKLNENNIKLSVLLDNVIDICLEKITNSCSVENQRITLMENDNALTSLQAVQTGKALIDYGKMFNRDDITSGGYLIVNSAIGSTSSLDLNTECAMYPVLVTNNSFYPHTKILGYYGDKCVWAWTCAANIFYDINIDGTIDLNIDFPQNKIHYIIFNGIPSFHSNIEIQKQKFRTDPRFETYNSSGYVYLNEEETLFIKSRHKSQIELIRLFCDPQPDFTR